jgi:hypothetical protein
MYVSANVCGLKGSAKHTNLLKRNRSAVHETKKENLLSRSAESRNVGALAEMDFLGFAIQLLSREPEEVHFAIGVVAWLIHSMPLTLQVGAAVKRSGAKCPYCLDLLHFISQSLAKFDEKGLFSWALLFFLCALLFLL